jgi:hypothetical protein
VLEWADRCRQRLLLIASAGRPLIGREEAVQMLCALLLEPECRLVTLTGTGGSGRTRMALEIAKLRSSGTTLWVRLWLAEPASIGDASGGCQVVAVSRHAWNACGSPTTNRTPKGSHRTA